MRRTLRLYRRLLGAHLRAALQYEADFWIMIAAAAMTQAVGVVFLGAIFAKIPHLNGWTFWEVVTVYAMVSLGEGSARCSSRAAGGWPGASTRASWTTCWSGRTRWRCR
ncbi:hypothetical protein ACFQX7_35090 [Luedemannella flava]